jgi:hypothetical protein
MAMPTSDAKAMDAIVGRTVTVVCPEEAVAKAATSVNQAYSGVRGGSILSSIRRATKRVKSMVVSSRKGIDVKMTRAASELSLLERPKWNQRLVDGVKTVASTPRIGFGGRMPKTARMKARFELHAHPELVGYLRKVTVGQPRTDATFLYMAQKGRPWMETRFPAWSELYGAEQLTRAIGVAMTASPAEEVVRQHLKGPANRNLHKVSGMALTGSLGKIGWFGKTRKLPSVAKQ